MKSVLTKMAALLVLLAALTFAVQGTASAQSFRGTHQSVSTAKTQARSPQDCAWEILSDWNTTFGVEVRKWIYNCDGEVYCAGIDHSYTGPFTIALSVYAYDGSQIFPTYLKEQYVYPGESVYTGPPNAPGGYANYICAAYQYYR